jgi:hypothetical protein
MPHATVCTQCQKVFCHYFRTVSVISCGVLSPHSVLLVFHCCIAIVAGGTSQRIFEDNHPLNSVLAFNIMIKFITSLKLVFSGNTNIAYAKKIFEKNYGLLSTKILMFCYKICDYLL